MEADETNGSPVDDWIARASITRVVNSYFRALDEKHFDESHFRQILAPDARLLRPNGVAAVGPSDIAASHARSFARFEATQHLVTGHDIDLDGDRATVRANLVAIHMWKDRPADASMLDRSFTAGDVVTAGLHRVGDEWMIATLEIRVVWRTGFLGDMAQTS